MDRFFRVFLITSLIAASQPAFADSVTDAYAAYQRGDFARAAQLYRAGAAQGNAQAQIALAFLYHDGQGVPQDYLRSYMWFTVATTRLDPASQDFADVSDARDITGKSMTRAQIERAHDLAESCIARSFKNCD